MVAAPGAGAGDEIREERMFDLQGSRPDLYIYFLYEFCNVPIINKSATKLKIQLSCFATENVVANSKKSGILKFFYLGPDLELDIISKYDITIFLGGPNWALGIQPLLQK